jgi:hypothetical protein
VCGDSNNFSLETSGRKERHMKLHEKSKQRFVREYANWKISALEDLAKSFPEKEVLNRASIAIIRNQVNGWELGMVTTDEIMAKIAEY